MNAIQITVYGHPAPAGSKRGFAFKRTNGSTGVAISDANPKSRLWKEAVSSAARLIYRGELLRGPLDVAMVFYRPRPAGHFGKAGTLNKAGRDAKAPVGRPDVLKLARGVEDALTSVVWHDDAQIVRELIEKQWGEPARVEIVIGLHYPMTEEIKEQLSLLEPAKAF